MKDGRGVRWEVDVALAAAVRPVVKSHSSMEDLKSISVRRVGIVGIHQDHKEWLSAISQSPDAISMQFVPIISLLSSSPVHGFLWHAMNLYIRYKPKIDELHQFLELQLLRQWSPLRDDLLLEFHPRHQRNRSPSLWFTFLVDSGYCPIIGIRLFLEGRNSHHLAVHVQHD